jgi:hypothetical protein
MDFGGFNWAILKFVGPLALLAAIAWAILRNRASRRSRAVTEEGTRRLYREEDKRERRGDDGAA